MPPNEASAISMRPTLFISDLHLSPARPVLVEAFHAFCRGPARAAAALYVLGDLFDAWIGDDQLREPLAAGVASALSSVAAAGVPVSLMRGNRDLLLGERFVAAAGATLLPDEIVVDLGGAPTLLLHGDELCTDDDAYQRFRAWAREPTRQRRFLALPYFLRRAIVAWMRRKSGEQTATKTQAMMDVNSGAVAAALRAHGVTRMIHGHTHRPAHHELVVEGRACERWVLPDWYDRASYLEVDAAGARLREVTAPSASPA
jgi:UDP-2,3-diacylglucosamine hydrolase